jgi:GT2 family glycosyltransferase
MHGSSEHHDVDLSVIVVNYNTRHLLREMMDTLQRAATGLSLQIIVIDNASRDGSAEYIRDTWPQVTLIANTVNVGFGRANNQALPLLRGRDVLLLNTDAFVAEDSLQVALRYLHAHADCGIVGVRLTDRDGRVQPSCRYFPTPWNAFLVTTGLFKVFTGTQLMDDVDWDDRRNAECDWVPGAFFLMRRALIDQVGMFDPRYFLYSEEVDLCRTTKAAGWKVLYCADTNVIHIGGESAKSDGPLSAGKQLSGLQLESELLYYRKYDGLAGVAGITCMGLLADTYLALKRLVKRPRHSLPLFQWIRLAIPLLWRTRFGARPTR